MGSVCRDYDNIIQLSHFLQGTAKRWEQVSAYVRTRTVEEVIDMVKHGLKSGKVAGSNVNGIAKKRQVPYSQ